MLGLVQRHDSRMRACKEHANFQQMGDGRDEASDIRQMYNRLCEGMRPESEQADFIHRNCIFLCPAERN